MNCFQHPQKPAVGNCTYCGRGLCQECLSVVESKLSCRGACQKEIARERRLLSLTESAAAQRSVVYETSGALQHRAFAFMAVFGTAMVAFGVIAFLGQMQVAGAVLVGLGAVFLINGFGMARAGRKFKKLAAESRTEGIST